MKKNLVSPNWFFLVLVFLVSCSEDSEVKPSSSYAWIPSPSVTGSIDVYRLQIENDGVLYALADLNGVKGIFKFSSDTWTLHKEINEPFFSGSSSNRFAITGNVIYYSTFNELYKIEGSLSEKMLAGFYIKNLQVLDGKLIVIGEDLKVSDTDYSFVVYDGSQFNGISNEYFTGNSFNVNEKLFLPGFPSYKYDGANLTALNFNGYFLAVDEDESLYYNFAESNQTAVYKRLKNEDEVKIGGSIPGLINFSTLSFFKGTQIGIASTNPTTFSVTYYLRDGNWVELPTIASISNVVAYENRLFATADFGELIELIPD
jgi:hypothetical protein